MPRKCIAYIYIKSTNDNNECCTRLLSAKSKVAPLKTITIPRLELCSAVLAVRLCEKVKASLNLNINRTLFWTDSMIVLGWLALSPSNLKVFIAHRISEIQDYTELSQWHHVSTNDNPADLISRGTSVENLKTNRLWWCGPEWLQNSMESEWPKLPKPPYDLPETKMTVSCVSVRNLNYIELFHRISNLSRLIRVVSYIFRFYHNCKNAKPKRVGPLAVDEIDRSICTLIKLAQLEMFPHEIKCITNSQPLDKKSRLLSLNPIIDSDGVLRVGG